MGLLGRLLKGGFFTKGTQFSVSGDINAIRDYIKEKCLNDRHPTQVGTKEQWFNKHIFANQKIDTDIANAFSFMFEMESKDKKSSAAFSGQADVVSQTVTVKIQITEYESEKGVEKHVESIKEAIVEKFSQI